MARKIFSLLLLFSVLLCAVCGTRNAAGTAGSDTAPSSRDIKPGTVPKEYYEPADHPGTLETFTYGTKNYIGDGSATQSKAVIYLPYGYNRNNVSTRYDILYLQHGAYGNERTWMYEYGDRFKNMIDHMIENRLILPLIIVMPFLPAGNNWYSDTTPVFYSEEIKNDLMPAVESHYHTYAENTAEKSFSASRGHRIFGGFSAGGTTTWRVFLDGLDRFEYFLPMSGGLTLGGNGSTAAQDAKELAKAAEASGYKEREYFIFAATGTKDVAYVGLSAQIDAMTDYIDAFVYTDEGFDSGNLMFYTVQGNRHDYPQTYEYVYNGLQELMHQMYVSLSEKVCK